MNTKNTLIILFVTVCAAFAGLATWQGFRMAQPPVSVAVPTATAVNYEVPDAAHIDARGYAKAPESQAATYAPRDFASVFPNLENAPQDWRKFKPVELTVASVAGTPLTFTMTEYKEENGRVTWMGRNEDMLLASFVFSANADAWAGVMVLPDGGEYAMHGTANGQIAVRRATEITIANACGLVDAHLPGNAPTTTTGDTIETFDTQPLPTEPELDVADVNGYYYTTLLMVVDKPFVDALGLPVTATQAQIDAQIDATCAAYVAAMNTVLANSQISNLRWMLAGTQIAPDDFVHVSVSNSLNELSENKGKMGIPARKEASRIGADQILFIAGSYVTGDSAGVAMSPDRVPGGVDNFFYPYAAVHDVFGIYTKCHELGHNFGLRHDRETDGIPDGDGKYYYGYKWYLPKLSNSSDLVLCGDVMSYATNRVAYFSNPQIELNNDDVAMGMYQFPTGTSPLGVAENQPKAANAARWMREKAQALASFRRSVSFLYNPASTTAAPGSHATFSALATVGRTDLGNKDEIQYQWYFNNTLIASATTPTYTLSNVTTANAGEYTVQATSLGGVTVHSTAAILTVSSGLPVISSQPQSTSVAKGGTFTLSANVSGYNINFQWRKNGTLIAGAIGTSYTKSNAAEGDAGNYTLTVSNENGSVTSNAATVTVTNNGSGGGGNGGGGGGGALGLFYLISLLSIVIIKRAKQNHP